MSNTATFHKKNLKRLKQLAWDCSECIKDSEMCHHFDYLKDYIKELEELPSFDEEKFEYFWKEYPHKIAKKVAEKIWLHIKVDDKLFATIMTALEKQKKSKQWTQNKGQYIPHPTTWLNQERWNDEVELPGNIGNSKYDDI